MMKANTMRFLRDYPDALSGGAGTVFIGAGVSMGAGYPSWAELLQEIGEELGVTSSDLHDLAALAQWSIQESGGATRVRNVIKDQIGKDHPVPKTLEVIARLPARYIWTTNYDRLIERAFGAITRPLDTVSSAEDLSLRATPGATRLLKMHGSIERLNDVVISTDDYELYRKKRGAFLPLLQAHLQSMSMLFLGISFSDPNVRHVLSLIRESFTEAPPEHFAIVKPPMRDQFKSDDEFKARQTQHSLWAKDLKRYGLVVVEIDDYAEVPELMRQVERRVAARRVWVSGSWPVEGGGPETLQVYKLAQAIGYHIGASGRDLVSGAGLVVGSASIAGFLDALRSGGGWDLERRLVARPFPQPLVGQAPDKAQWTALRSELARLAGVVIFIGGVKIEDGKPVIAGGVLEEFDLAKGAGAFLLPIGSVGGTALEIAQQMTGSDLPSEGAAAIRPTDAELKQLSDSAAPVETLVKCVADILTRLSKLS